MLEARGTADSHRIAYRPDLDGLRAIAVLSVIAYHLWPKLLPGGYLGVDVFFVISGYLITRIIWQEALNREFTFARFYERRVRRIMPAFLFLLIVVSPFAILFLLPADLIGYAKSTLASLASSANLYFWRTTGYFAQIAAYKPLLNVWSLGVEEQFYIVFPLFLILCIRWSRSAAVPLTSIFVLLSLLADAFSGRFGLSVAAFYLLPTRAWELGAGALLALSGGGKVREPWLWQTLAAFAAVLIIVSLGLNDEWLHGLMPPAVLAVSGSTLAIFLGVAGKTWLNRLLSNSLMVGIGLISYSLYLWHWPILVFAHYYLVRPVLSPVQTVIVLALMFALATASWRYVERPFRNRSMPIGAVLVRVASGCILVAGTAAAALAAHGFPSRFSPAVGKIDAVVDSNYRCILSDYFPFGALRACPLYLPSRNPADATVVLLGNSHAQMYAPLVTEIVRENSEKGMLVPLNSCLPMPDLNLSKGCMAQASENLAAIEALAGVHVVIIAMTWDAPKFTPRGMVPKGSETAYFIASLDRLIDSLQEHGKKVVLVGPLAIPSSDVASIVARQMAFHHRVDEPMSSPKKSFMAKHGAVLQHFAARNDIVLIRPDLVQCRSDRCNYFIQGIPLFADDNHLARTALPLFRTLFEPALDRAFGSYRWPAASNYK